LTVSGWLFDSYSLGDRMVFWLLTERGNAVRLEEKWTPSFFVGADRADLTALTKNDDCYGRFVKEYEFVSRYERLADQKRSEVLKVTPLSSRSAKGLAKKIWMSGHFGRYRLYNVDLLPAQTYFYERDLFPLAFCEVDASNSQLKWKIDDDVWSTNYRLPDFKKIHVDIYPRKEGKIARLSDRLDSISIKRENDSTYDIKLQSEADMISECVSAVTKFNPDFVFTENGDSFGLPYLIRRAEEGGVGLYLGREHVSLTAPPYEGKPYTSYGKVFFKPAAIDLLGRIHLDSRNSFVWRESGLHGYYEVARICRMPLHSAFRASIGTCLSSLQFYHATKRGILIPWKPVEAEHFKTLEDLLIADRGGLILVPQIGVHERVGEFDFVSLFPNIMRKMNVSGETVRCECCADSDEKVPELGCNICTKKIGIVPTALEIVLKKRAEYKRMQKSARHEAVITIYRDRQGALKWINVTSFGYLGFNKSRFGVIDSHQAVCAFDRDVMVKAIRTAEGLDFIVIDGIVDSLWVKKAHSTVAEYTRLKEAIEKATGFEISFEGEYKWIVFLPSKENDWVPVPNRYFGAFSDGTVKVRGMEARRHDTPPYLSRFQEEILELMAKGDTAEQVRALMPKVKEIFEEHASMLKKHDVPIGDLVFTKQLSKDSAEYLSRSTVENSALRQLADEGMFLRAGQIIQYVITDYYRKNSRKRAVPVELIDDNTVYDARRYVELLAETGNSVTQPFGYMIG